MSEPSTEPTTDPAPTTDPPTPQPPAGVSEEAWNALGDPGKKAITAEREAREAAEKAAADYRTKLDEIEKANLSEVERARRDAEDARTELESLRAVATKARIQAKHGISDDLAAKFLTASTEDDLEAQATALAELVTDRKKNGNTAPYQGRIPQSGARPSSWTDVLQELDRQRQP